MCGRFQHQMDASVLLEVTRSLRVEICAESNRPPSEKNPAIRPLSINIVGTRNCETQTIENNLWHVISLLQGCSHEIAQTCLPKLPRSSKIRN